MLGLGGRTPNIKSIAPNQKGIFYLSGKGGNFSFIASFETDSIPQKITKEASKSISSAIRHWSDYLVCLKDVNVFKKRVGIKEIVNELELTKNKAMWGSSLQGGLRRISEKDFKKIISLSK